MRTVMQGAATRGREVMQITELFNRPRGLPMVHRQNGGTVRGTETGRTMISRMVRREVLETQASVVGVATSMQMFTTRGTQSRLQRVLTATTAGGGVRTAEEVTRAQVGARGTQAIETEVVAVVKGRVLVARIREGNTGTVGRRAL